MDLFRFFRKLFHRAGAQVALVSTPACSLVSSEVACKPVSPGAAPLVGVMLLREEVLDKAGRLAGYRFSCGLSKDGLGTLDGYEGALLNAQVRTLAERRVAVVAIQLDDALLLDLAIIRAPHAVVHVMCRHVEVVEPRNLVVLQSLRASGLGLALSVGDLAELQVLTPALALATHAVIDISAHPIQDFEQLVIALQEACPHLTLMVENVATWPLRHMCVAMGIEYASGYFLSTVDEREQGEKISDSRLVLMDMLNILRNDGGAEALAAVAKRDPSVSVHLLSMANAPAYGLKAPLTGIDQAIVVLGRETLYRWLAVTLFRAGSDRARDETLLEVALARASFLEKAGLAVGTRQNADELFLVGLLSFVDTLLGMPIEAVLKELTLPAVIRDVLRDSEGPYARFLLLALAVERCQVQRATQLSMALGIEPDALTTYRNEAQQWAELAVQSA